jgi:hypothetical protein
MSDPKEDSLNVHFNISRKLRLVPSIQVKKNEITEKESKITGYEDRIVCFLDILAWKEKINKISNNDKKVVKLYNKYQKFIRTIENIVTDYKGYVDVKVVSDSFFISWKSETDNLTKSILAQLKEQIQNMYKNDFLLQGGIKKGKFIQKKAILFGPALNEAYELQKKCAIYPRIIFDKDIIDDYFFNSDRNHDKNLEKLIKKDSDGFYYLDYLSLDSHTLKNGVIGQIEFYKQSKKIIEDGLKNKLPNISMKYEWMKIKHNEAIIFMENKAPVLDRYIVN